MSNNKEVLEAFKEWLLNQGKTVNTVKNYLKIVNYFYVWYFDKNNKQVDYKVVTSTELENWRHYLITEAKKKNGERLSIRTINNYIVSLKTFFRFLLEVRFIQHNPSIGINTHEQRYEKNTRWLQYNEIKIVIRTIEDPILKDKNPWKYARNRLIILSMLYAGLRISEVTNLTVQDIQEKMIRISGRKGHADRKIPINNILAIAIEEWFVERSKKSPNTDYLVVSQKGGKLTVSGIYSLFENLIESTGIHDLTPISLRHTFARNLLKSGISVLDAATLLGHNDLDTTRSYL